MSDVTRVCKKCGKTKPLHMMAKKDSKSPYYRHECQKCFNRRHHEYHFGTERYRAYRAAGERKRRARPEMKPKIRAYGMVRRALKTGKLVRGKCEVCGSLETEAHHDDYAKPLDVRWLCDPHHKEVHGRAY